MEMRRYSRLTGGKQSSLEISTFLILLASSTVSQTGSANVFGCQESKKLTAHSLHQFCQVARAGDGAAAPKRLESGLHDLARGLVDAYLQLHDVAACRSANEARADRRVRPVERAGVAWPGVVVEQCSQMTR